jgi:hypothetical protein
MVRESILIGTVCIGAESAVDVSILTESVCAIALKFE